MNKRILNCAIAEFIYFENPLLELMLVDELIVSRMSFEEIAPIVPYVIEGRLRVRNTENTVWFGAKLGDEVVGVVSCVLRRAYIYYNTDFVKKEFRKKGIYTRLFEERDKYVLTLNRDLIRAKCTRYSLNHYLKNGFTATAKGGSLTPVEKKLGKS
jgi:GNAT superfamily N-acetyltransferase